MHKKEAVWRLWNKLQTPDSANDLQAVGFSDGKQNFPSSGGNQFAKKSSDFDGDSEDMIVPHESDNEAESIIKQFDTEFRNVDENNGKNDPIDDQINDVLDKDSEKKKLLNLENFNKLTERRKDEFSNKKIKNKQKVIEKLLKENKQKIEKLKSTSKVTKDMFPTQQSPRPLTRIKTK